MKHNTTLNSILILSLILLSVASLFAAPAARAASAQAYPAGMVSYWKLDEGSGTTTNDSADSNPGTIHGATWASGQVGNAMNFGGTNYVEVPDSTNLNIPDVVTTEAWVNFTTFSATDHNTVIAKWNDGLAKHNYFLGLGHGAAVFFVGVNGTIYGINSQVLQTNQWYHLAGTYDGAAINIYVNGLLANSLAVTGPLEMGSTNVYIGAELDGQFPRYFNGLIDEAAIYNRALTSQEIQHHYQDGLVGLGYSPLPTPTPTVTPTTTWTPTLTPSPTDTITVTPTATNSALPDLVVIAMQIELETGGACNFSSTNLGLRVWFKNNGTASAGPFVVDANGAQQAFASGLAAGQMGDLWFADYNYMSTNTAWVDATDQVVESNESNNQLSAMVPIPTLPPTCTPTSTQTPTFTLTPTVTLTPSLTPTMTPTDTVTVTPTSHPGVPILGAPNDGATLPQPVAPNEWYFNWSARTGPCYSSIYINGPGGRQIFSGQITVNYEYHYTGPALPDDALGPWYWSVGVYCPLGSNHSETRTFWVQPASTPTPTPTVTNTPTRTRTPTPIAKTFTSIAAQDGWILESGETGSTGGSLNSSAATFQLGDDTANRQYRAVLSFDTSALPDNAVIKSAQVKIMQSGAVAGKNPFSVLGSLWVDIRQGFFGSANSLQLGDFNAAASAVKVGAFNKTPVGGWYTDTLTAAGLAKINRVGPTQLRLYFATDDNNNRIADTMKFFSGNSATNKPVLVITYTVP